MQDWGGESGTTAKLYEAPKPKSDPEVLEISYAAVPDMKDQAKEAASGLSSSPEASIAKMIELCDHIKYGLGYRAALGEIPGLITTLLSLVNPEDPDTPVSKAALHMLFALARHKENTEAIFVAGGVPVLVKAFKKKWPEENTKECPDGTTVIDIGCDVVPGGHVSGTLKKMISHGSKYTSAIVKADGMNALTTGFRNYKINDDVAESVPAYGQRMRLITEVEEYDKEGETGAA